MSIYPRISLTIWNGFWLVLPLLLLRFGISGLVHKPASGKLDHFPPVVGRERTALKVYFITNTFLIFSPILARIRVNAPISLIGGVIYAVGIVLLRVSLVDFCASGDGLVVRGIYRFSRNPIYVAYFLIFVGTAFLTASWTHLLVAVVYQISVHGLVRSEERWCREKFGKRYADYCRKVRRYV